VVLGCQSGNSCLVSCLSENTYLLEGEDGLTRTLTFRGGPVDGETHETEYPDARTVIVPMIGLAVQKWEVREPVPRIRPREMFRRGVYVRVGKRDLFWEGVE
jgi:hypothetical protein